jgi:hypothetical protein
MEELKKKVALNLMTHYEGNELMFFKRDFCNSCRVVSTDDPNKFKVEKSIRKGIVNKETDDLHGVANLMVQFAAEDIHPEKNLLFPKGLQDAIMLCREEYKKNVPAKEEKKRGYKSLHASEYIDTI